MCWTVGRLDVLYEKFSFQNSRFFVLHFFIQGVWGIEMVYHNNTGLWKLEMSAYLIRKTKIPAGDQRESKYIRNSQVLVCFHHQAFAEGLCHIVHGRYRNLEQYNLSSWFAFPFSVP